MSKKIDNFLRNFVRRTRRFSWFNIHPLSFIHRKSVTQFNNFTLLWFCFYLLSGCNNLHNRLWRLLFKYICKNLWKSDSRLRPNSNFNSVLEVLKLVVTSNSGPILIFPWIHPFGWEAWSSWGKSVFATSPLFEIVENHQCLWSRNIAPLQQQA